MRSDQSFLSVLVGLIVLSLVFFVIERIVGRGRRQPVFRQGWATDVVYWFGTIFRIA